MNKALTFFLALSILGTLTGVALLVVVGTSGLEGLNLGLIP